MAEKLLMDMLDGELMEHYRKKCEPVAFSPRDCELEMQRRATERHNREMRLQSWAMFAVAIGTACAAAVGLWK
jgi:hypothetical protein